MAALEAHRLREVLAANLRRLRREAGASQEAFAELCRIHRTYLGALERSERNVSIDCLQRIADALEIKAFELLRP